jgi:outer membrane protein
MPMSGSSASLRSILMLAVALTTCAGVAGDLRIAVIDPNRIVEESPQYEEARQTLSTEVAEREADLLDQQESLDRLNAKLERDGALMSEEEAKRLQNDIRARKRRLRYAKAELQEDFALRQSELRTKLVKQVEEVVRQIAKEQEIDLIVSEGVVYFSDRIDISADVVQRLKEEFGGR